VTTRRARPKAGAGKAAPPATLVIFGGTGDLTKRLLMPALVNLTRAGLLPEEFAVLALGRRTLSNDAFRAELAASARAIGTIDTTSAEWRWLSRRLAYLSGSFDDPDTFRRLAERLEGSVLFSAPTAWRRRPPDIGVGW